MVIAEISNCNPGHRLI